MLPREIEEATKLSTLEQVERARTARQWAARVLALITEAACSVRLAVQAIEEADEAPGCSEQRRRP